MKPWLRWALAGAVTLSGARADGPPADTGKFDLCLALNNRITGPRAPDRPLPMLDGEPSQGLHPACTVRWSTLSPAGKPLDVLTCYQGSLLQIENNSACGHRTGFLWVNSRWVKTSAEQAYEERQGQQPKARTTAAVCQKLETNPLAVTRDVPPDCAPREDESSADSASAKPTPPPPATADKAPKPSPPK